MAVTDDQSRLDVVSEPGQFRLLLDGDTVGWALVSEADGVLTIAHVETAPEHRGKQFAARLMDGVLDHAETRSLRVRPRCGYAVQHLRAHPERHDLLA